MPMRFTIGNYFLVAIQISAIVGSTTIHSGEVLLPKNDMKKDGVMKASGVVENSPSNTFYIRHGRSRVRDQHIWRERRTHPNSNNTVLTHSPTEGLGTYDNTTNNGSLDKSNKLRMLSTTRAAMSSRIPTGNGHLFGSDFWQNSDQNGSFIMLERITPTTPALKHLAKDFHPSTFSPLTITMPTPTLVTHKIRKLHKKKITESIRQRVDKSFGVRPSKNHRSLVQAEHLQGRPTESDSIHDVSQAISNDDFNDPLKAKSEEETYRMEDDAVNIQEFLGSNMPDDEYPNDESDVSNNQEDEITEADKHVTIAATIVTDTPYAIENEVGRYAHSDMMRTKLFKTPEMDVNGSSIKEYQLNEIDTIPSSAKEQDFKKHLSKEAIDSENEYGPNMQSANTTMLGLHSNTNRNQQSIGLKSETRNDSQEIREEVENEHDYSFNGDENALKSNESVSIEDENLSFSVTYSPDSAGQGFDLDSAEPNQLASTSVGGIGLDRQSTLEFEEISFEDDRSSDTGLMDGSETSLSVDRSGFVPNVNDDDNEALDTSRFLAGVVDGANEDEIYDWDEISRNNRRNLMRGRDVVTKFLQIVETQHMLGSNCEAGTSLNLGEGVVDRYAQERFRVEAEVAVNRANMLTRIFKMTSRAVQSDVNLLHASVLSMVEFDDDIFAAGNCFDWNEHPSQPGLFCPFAYRLPAPQLGAIFAKDLATEYHYLGNTSEWFFQARKNAEKVIARNEQYLKAFHLYSNKTDERIEDDTLAVKYEDGRWSKPYYDCGGGNIWMLTYTVPFFGYENSTYHFKGTSGIDIDLRRVDIDQCPQRSTPGMTQPLNIFAGTDKCKQRTTMCEALKGLGFRRGSYKCICRKGYFFPDTLTVQKYFNGSLLEEEYEKLMLGRNSTYNVANEYECLPCAEGCDSCEDGSPCIAALNWPMRTSILVLACTVIGLLPPAAWFTFRYQQVKVVRAASPALLRVIALGAFFIYCTNIVMYPNPNLYSCTARIWLREIGFSLTYGALMLKTWRISVIFRVRSAKAVKITDAALLKRLGCICGVIGTFLLVRTLVSPPDVVVGRTADDLKAFLCKTDWWDYTFTSMEVLFLAWGVRLCIMVRKAPSEFNESRFISMAIYNEFLLTCFLNVSMLFLQSPANPDLLYIIFFCHTQLTVTLLLGLIFGSKVYIVLRSGKSHHEAIGMGAKASGAKFNFRPQVRTFANPSSVTTSTAQVVGTNSAETKLSDQEALEEIRQLSIQLQRIQEMAPPKGVAVMTISSLLDGLKTPGGMMVVAAAASQAANQSGNQLQLRQQQQPLLALNAEVEKYTQQLQVQQNNNFGSKISKESAFKSEEKAVNTDICGKNISLELLESSQFHIICNRCLESSRDAQTSEKKASPKSLPLTACQQLGSPHAEGSLSFANIKLECMCSQPDDLDLIQRQRRTRNMRTAATNTPPPSTRSLRSRNKSKGDVTGEAVCYQICDNCKKKYNSNKSRKNKRISRSGSSNRVKQSRLEKMQHKHSCSVGSPSAGGGGISQAQSADILETRLSTTRVADVAMTTKKVYSIDDITFYTSSTSRCSTSDGDSNAESHDGSGEVSIQVEMKTATVIESPTKAERPNVDVSPDCVEAEAPADAPTQSQSNLSITSHNSNGADGSLSATNGASENNRPKRPEKLLLDLNDRSKYSKEVSV